MMGRRKIYPTALMPFVGTYHIVWEEVEVLLIGDDGISRVRLCGMLMDVYTDTLRFEGKRRD